MDMAIIETTKRSGRGLVTAIALVAAVSLTAAPSPASAHGGGGPRAAVGLGVRAPPARPPLSRRPGAAAPRSPVPMAPAGPAPPPGAADRDGGRPIGRPLRFCA